MSIRLIVNADDYGRSAGISRGIREAHARGIVSSTTCMMNFPTTAADIALAAAETPTLGLGVHLVLTSGSPLLPAAEVPTLVNAQGEFPTLTEYMATIKAINPQEAKAEWTAQIEAFRQARGRNPTHLDSHHHASYYTEGLLQAMLELAQQYNVPIRQLLSSEIPQNLGWLPEETQKIVEYGPRLQAQFNVPTSDVFYVTFYDEGATLEGLQQMIADLPEEGVFEIMCHPGYVGPDLVPFSAYAWPREKELAILTDPSLRPQLADRNIQLVSYDTFNAPA